MTRVKKGIGLAYALAIGTIVSFRMCFVALFFLFLSLGVVHGQARNGSFPKGKWLTIDTCVIQLDMFTLVPGTVYFIDDGDTLQGIQVSHKSIQLDAGLCRALTGKKVWVSYRVFPFDVTTAVALMHKDSLTQGKGSGPQVFEYTSGQKSQGMIDAKGLDYRGTFSRGFSVGNSQSLVLNSNFDMQLKGDLGGGLKLVAAISDENLPIQAQGNTQQLQEFDKVFIQLAKGNTTITAGDYELVKPAGYFLNYFKKLEGLSVSTLVEQPGKAAVFAKGSFAVSRGKFARRTLQISEGNQGPYRLTGNFNERFILVLSGTEKVYFNGILLERGYDFDYIIDYNRAELTFSPTRPVARDSRIIVEFEYTDISYLRTLYATETEFRGKNWKSGLNIYSEQDSRQVTGEGQPDSIGVHILQKSGDDLSKAVRNSFRQLSEAERKQTNGILYGAIPSPSEPGGLILYYTENADSAIYQASFTEVGPGKGSYIIDNEKLKNGRVYKYAGANLGTYLPVVQLIPPEQKQMASAYVQAQPFKGMELDGEVALSHYDVNRLSENGDADNVGAASRIRLRQEITLDSAQQETWFGMVRHEAVGNHFSPLNPFRPPEFLRDWNLNALLANGSENVLHLTTGYQNGQHILAEYGVQWFDRKGIFSGLKQGGSVALAVRRWQVRATGQFLETSSPFLGQATKFSRPNIRATYFLNENKTVQMTAELDAETNLIRGLSKDTLSGRSFSFRHYKWFFGTDFDKNLAVKTGFSLRDDYFGKANVLSQASRAVELELAGKWVVPGSDLQWSFIARDLYIRDAVLLPNDKNKRTLLGKVDHSFSFFRQAFRATTSYNTTSGQEPRFEYVYQKVETGQGEYVYIGDTTAAYKINIQDFRYDPTNPLANYIRLSLPNNELIRTTNLELNQNLALDGAKWTAGIQKPTVFSNVLSRFSVLSNIRLIKKQRDNQVLPISSFFQFGVEDTSLIAYTSQVSHTLFINKGQARYDMQMGRRSNQSRIILVSGPEARSTSDWFARARWGFATAADVIFYIEKGRKAVEVLAQPARNLDILYVRIRPEINVRPTSRLRLVGRFMYQSKYQQILSLDKATFYDASVEFAYRQTSEVSVDVSFSRVSIVFTGIPNSFMEYDLLEGLKNGTNFLWQSSFTKRIAKNVDFTLRYEGRKTGLAPVVHVGRVQLKATF